MNGIVAVMAEQYGMVPQAFEQTIRKTVMPSNASPEEFAAFLMVASKYQLNPLTREIYAFPKRGGGIQVIVSVDGWCNILNSHPMFDGMTFDDTIDAKGNVTAITCRIFRKDRSRAIECTEYLAECDQHTPPWKQWPRRMLRHKSMVQAARYAFALVGVIDPDEYERYPAVTPNPLAKPNSAEHQSNAYAQTLTERLESLANAETGELKVDAETGEIKLEPDLPSPYSVPEPPGTTYDALDDDSADEEWLINPDSAAYRKGVADGQEKTGRCRSSKVLADPQMLANWRAGYESVTPLEASP